DPEGVSAVVEFDRRGGMFSEGGEVHSGFRVGHDDADRLDWAGTLDSWIEESLGRHRELFGGQHHGYGERYHEEEEERGGMLGVVGGAAAGVVGGLAAGYVVSEVVDGIGEDSDGEEQAEEEEEESDEE
ncbi:sporulation protein, partial [Nocardiopsis tropica]|nr:sporulation protein [Nocardiopsis tropica]